MGVAILPGLVYGSAMKRTSVQCRNAMTRHTVRATFASTDSGAAVTHLPMRPLRPTPNYCAAASASDGQSGGEWRCRHHEAKAVQVVDRLLRMVTRNLRRPGYVVVYEPFVEGCALYLNVCWPSGVTNQTSLGDYANRNRRSTRSWRPMPRPNVRQKMSDLVGTVLA